MRGELEQNESNCFQNSGASADDLRYRRYQSKCSPQCDEGTGWFERVARNHAKILMTTSDTFTRAELQISQTFGENTATTKIVKYRDMRL